MAISQASQVVLVVKNLPANAGDIRDAGSILESGRSPGGRRGNPLQDSFLENPMDGGAWQAMVYRITKSQVWLKLLSTHTAHTRPFPTTAIAEASHCNPCKHHSLESIFSMQHFFFLFELAHNRRILKKHFISIISLQQLPTFDKSCFY